MAPTKIVLPAEIQDFFLGQVSPDFLKAVLRSALQAYRDASEYCFTSYPSGLAKDASGSDRRVRMESDWLGIAERFKKNERPVMAAICQYKRRTGSYVELTSGLAKMTESCVPSPHDLPREAQFRETLARTGQISLFVKEEEPNADVYLYGIVLHGVHPNATKRERCAFACIRFPDQEFQGYLGGKIDLFAMFPEVINEFYGAADEVGPAVVLPRKLAKEAGTA